MIRRARVRSMIVAVGLLGPVALGAGCGGGSGGAAWDETTPAPQTATEERRALHDQRVAEGDAAFEQREDEQQLRAAITAWTQALEADPSDSVLWHRLARAQYFLADGYLVARDSGSTLDPEATQTYQAAIQSAARSLQLLSPEFAERMRAGAPPEQAVAVLDEQAVPALYWRAAALGKWARRDGFATVLAYKDEIRAMMTRCLELDRDYFYSGPDRYFGAFFAVAPAYSGGDLQRARQHFEYAIARSPDYYGTHVLYALEYAVKMQDRELFERELRLVVDGSPDVIPEVRAENLVEQRKAREALERIDSLFR